MEIELFETADEEIIHRQFAIFFSGGGAAAALNS